MNNNTVEIVGGVAMGCMVAFTLAALSLIGCCDCPKPACRCNLLETSEPNETIKAGAIEQIQNDQKKAIEFRTQTLQRAIDSAAEMGELQTQIDALAKRVERVEQAHGIVPEKPAKRRFAEPMPSDDCDPLLPPKPAEPIVVDEPIRDTTVCEVLP